jgi:hypothetical protein
MNKELALRITAQLELAQDLAGNASKRVAKLDPDNIPAGLSMAISHATNAVNSSLRTLEVLLDEVETQNLR